MTSPLWKNSYASVPSSGPTSGQVAQARLRLHAQHHPVAHSALWGAGAGVIALLLAGMLTAPNLTDPAGVPGWVLGAVAIMTLAVTLLSGLAAYSILRVMPASPETDPVRYAIARRQAASGAPGPDEQVNRTARHMIDHLVYVSNPTYRFVPLLIAAAAFAVRPLIDMAGSGAETWTLFEFAPAALFIVGMVVIEPLAEREQTACESFREQYDTE
ncbi:hypothetical protein [Nocardiopsis sp. JB363]|uniref:hypothetical protein n=1 Tax=Nocardiopsis sp. JB363 TaxID=1434837 RepID=UPI000B35C9B8|nr:hypothetical protein [Nocardiopsis sp. JB363]